VTLLVLLVLLLYSSKPSSSN